MNLDRIIELADIDMDEDAYASEKASGKFRMAEANLANLEKIFEPDSYLYRDTKRAGGDTAEYDLVYKSIQHLRAAVKHAEETAQIPDVKSKRDRSGW